MRECKPRERRRLCNLYMYHVNMYVCIYVCVDRRALARGRPNDSKAADNVRVGFSLCAKMTEQRKMTGVIVRSRVMSRAAVREPLALWTVYVNCMRTCANRQTDRQTDTRAAWRRGPLCPLILSFDLPYFLSHSRSFRPPRAYSLATLPTLPA